VGRGEGKARRRERGRGEVSPRPRRGKKPSSAPTAALWWGRERSMEGDDLSGSLSRRALPSAGTNTDATARGRHLMHLCVRASAAAKIFFTARYTQVRERVCTRVVDQRRETSVRPFPQPAQPPSPLPHRVKISPPARILLYTSAPANRHLQPPLSAPFVIEFSPGG